MQARYGAESRTALMGFRFRRSVKLLPGIRLNFGKRGVSMSAGPRGATVNIGRKGTRLTTSLPGTGLSYSQRINSASNDPGPRATSNDIPTSTAVWLIVMALGLFAMLTRVSTLMIGGWFVAFVSMTFVLKGSSIILRIGGAFLFACVLLVLAMKWGL